MYQLLWQTTHISAAKGQEKHEVSAQGWHCCLIMLIFEVGRVTLELAIKVDGGQLERQ